MPYSESFPFLTHQTGWGYWQGGAGQGGVAGQVGWYGPAAVNVHTARKGVCNGRVKNALQALYNRVGRENLGGV